MEAIVDQVIALVAELKFQDFESVKIAFHDNLEISLSDEWTLKFDSIGRGWIAIPNHGFSGELASCCGVFICVIEGCKGYTYGGVICKDHAPWESLVHLSDSSGFGTDESWGKELCSPIVDLTEGDSLVDLPSSVTLHHSLETGLMTTKLVQAVLNELVEERKSYFGSEDSPEYLHHYVLHSLWNWPYWSKIHQVIIKKSYQHSRSIRFESTNGKFVFYTCGKFPFCQNIAMIFRPAHLFHRYCVQHQNECTDLIKRSAVYGKNMKLMLLLDLAKRVSAGTLTPEGQWLALYSFLYAKGESGQVVHNEGYEVIVSVSKQGQLKTESTHTTGSSAVCIGRRFKCLKCIKTTAINLHYCASCDKLTDKFCPQTVMQDVTYGSESDSFFKYW